MSFIDGLAHSVALAREALDLEHARHAALIKRLELCRELIDVEQKMEKMRGENGFVEKQLEGLWEKAMKSRSKDESRDWLDGKGAVKMERKSSREREGTVESDSSVEIVKVVKQRVAKSEEDGAESDTISARVKKKKRNVKRSWVLSRSPRSHRRPTNAKSTTASGSDGGHVYYKPVSPPHIWIFV
ncbi:hypothetical protein AMATHDRAFT_1384 [Amanita thiersii Skay4041]|uniref:Uncharacterized protein n=1 Tax=Amanita thiersii Skay4041 TaxID=703135 RepID=A0A2A9NT94_9AGAR|nr:hypothetical protein AMATHDRAFT_1384 [Amanita thiersii Skay4041]